MPNVWGNFPDWGLTIILILWLVLETVLAFALFNHRRASYILTYCIALFVLVFHIWYFIDQSKINMYPVEFSHISYFVFSVSVVFGSKKMQSFAGFCGMLTGLAFLIAGCFSPQSMLDDAASGVSLFISVMRHELLWLGGLLLFLNVVRFNIKDIWISVLGIALIVGFSFLVHYHIIYPDFVKWDDMVIIKIAEGTILSYVVSGELPMAVRVLTVIGIFILVAAALVAYFKVNNLVYDRRLKKQLMHGGKEDALELGIIPLVKYLFKRAGVTKLPRPHFKKSKEYNCDELEAMQETGVCTEPQNREKADDKA